MLVDDSATELYLLERLIASAADLTLVGTARDGREALALLPVLQPEVVCTDYHMPVMDGLELIVRAMDAHPCAFLVLSAAVQADQKDTIFKMLAAGAVDVIAKPQGHTGGLSPLEARALLERIRSIGGAQRARPRKAARALPPITRDSGRARPGQIALVAVGASTGGPQALSGLLAPLPRTFAAPIVCVQHISPGFLEGLVRWLQSHCRLKLGLAESGQRPEPGQVYFAPDGYHLTINPDGRLGFAPCVDGDLHCPRVDRLLQSVASVHGARGLGILLSGMGRDGAVGLKRMRDAGSPTIVQDEATSVIYGMPRAAVDLGAAEHVLPVDAIAPMLLRLVNRSPATRSL